MKFQRKPEPVEAQFEAEQFFVDSDIVDWPPGVFVHEGRHGIYTMSGFRHVNNGDWIITNPAGDLRVTTKDEFEDLYEAVE